MTSSTKIKTDFREITIKEGEGEFCFHSESNIVLDEWLNTIDGYVLDFLCLREVHPSPC